MCAPTPAQVMPSKNAGPEVRLLRWQEEKLRARAREAKAAREAAARSKWLGATALARGADDELKDMKGMTLAAMLAMAARQVRNAPVPLCVCVTPEGHETRCHSDHGCPAGWVRQQGLACVHY